MKVPRDRTYVLYAIAVKLTSHYNITFCIDENKQLIYVFPP